MMAVETASKQGWSTAQYLEVLDDGDETSAPPHVLLAAAWGSWADDKPKGGDGAAARKK